MRMVFLNLPIADVAASESFFTALGFSVDPEFKDETTTCIVVEEHIVVLLHLPEKWAGFLHSPPAPAGTTEVLIALSGDSKEAVLELKEKVLAHGGSPYGDDQDFGFMYGVSFRDPDGHVWECTWMDLEAARASGSL